jgi:hypothetical protein
MSYASVEPIYSLLFIGEEVYLAISPATEQYSKFGPQTSVFCKKGEMMLMMMSCLWGVVVVECEAVDMVGYEMAD